MQHSNLITRKIVMMSQPLIHTLYKNYFKIPAQVSTLETLQDISVIKFRVENMNKNMSRLIAKLYMRN